MVLMEMFKVVFLLMLAGIDGAEHIYKDSEGNLIINGTMLQYNETVNVDGIYLELPVDSDLSFVVYAVNMTEFNENLTESRKCEITVSSVNKLFTVRKNQQGCRMDLGHGLEPWFFLYDQNQTFLVNATIDKYQLTYQTGDKTNSTTIPFTGDLFFSNYGEKHILSLSAMVKFTNGICPLIAKISSSKGINIKTLEYVKESGESEKKDPWTDSQFLGAAAVVLILFAGISCGSGLLFSSLCFLFKRRGHKEEKPKKDKVSKNKAKTKKDKSKKTNQTKSSKTKQIKSSKTKQTKSSKTKEKTAVEKSAKSDKVKSSNANSKVDQKQCKDQSKSGFETVSKAA